MKTTRAACFQFLFLFLLYFTQICCVAGYLNNKVNRMPPSDVMQQPRTIQRQNNNVESSASLNERQDISKVMEKYMNLTVDPCSDFYEYACGNWALHNSDQLQEGQLGTAQHLVEASIEEQLRVIISAPPQSQPLSPQHQSNVYSPRSVANVRKVRSFYDSCVAVEANADQRRQFLLKVLRENGGLRNVPDSNYQSNHHWLITLTSMRRNYGLDILIGLDVDLNLQQMHGNSLYIGEPRLTIIPEEYCSATATREANVRSDIYEKIQQQVAEDMRYWFAMETDEAARLSGDIVRFEFELCKHMREQQIMPDNAAQQEAAQASVYGGHSRVGKDRLRQQPGGLSQYTRLTLIELNSSVGNMLNFKKFIEDILDGFSPDYVYLRSKNYLTHLMATVRTSNQYTITSYILYRALLELDQPREVPPMQRPRQCVQMLKRLFPEVLGEMYQRQVQRDDVLSDMHEVFSNIVKAFEQQLRVEWMVENDRRAARNKLSQYHTKFPDYQGVDLSELHFQNNDDYWRMLETTLRYNTRAQLNGLRGNALAHYAEGVVNAFEVRAALAPRQQAVFVGWGLMQAPYYSFYYPKAMKYALLGQRLASTLLQDFDDAGWNRNPQAVSSWNELTMEGYRNASECLRAQYSNYLSDQPNEFRNSTRLREIIAESGALNVAFNAYLGWLELQDKLSPALLRETLPELNFTNTQLFFIYFAQTRCWAKGGEQPAPEAMPLMQHTPQRWDVNGPLSNSEQFGREFGCALGTNMNSGNKCLIF